MKDATIVFVVLCTILATTSSSPADLPATQPTTQPAASPEAQYPGRTKIARWDVILNETGMEAIRDLGLAEVKTKSVGYEAYLSDGAALRSAVVQAAATNGVEKYSRLMALSIGDLQSHRATFMTQYGGSSLAPITGTAVGQGSIHYEGVGENRIHISVNFPSIDNEFTSNDQSLKAPATSISFDTDLDVGSAMVHIAQFSDSTNAVHYHMIVWEAYKAKSWQVNYFQRLREARWWCENGPDTLRAWSNAAVVWSAGAKHDPHTVSPDFETKVEDGKTVHMLGATRSDSWPFCWWDGQGQPVALIYDQVYFGNQAKKEWCDVELTGAEGQTSRLMPIPYPPQSQPANGVMMLPYTEWMFTNTNSSEEVTFGVSVGPWTKIGQIDIGGTIDFQNKTYSLNLMQDTGGVLALSLSSGKDTENGDWITVSAVKKDGTELNPNNVRELTPKNFNISPTYFQGVSKDDIQTFNVWTRKRKLITYRHIPYQPSPPPAMDVTPQQVAAAEAKLFPVQTPPPPTRPASSVK